MKLKTLLFSLIAMLTLAFGMQQTAFAAKHDSSLKSHHHKHKKHCKPCNGPRPENTLPDYYAQANTFEPVHLKSSLPWEFVKDNVKTWRFLLINMDPTSFDTVKLDKLSCVIENYICTYFYPTYRVKIKIDVIVPPTDAQLVANTLPTTTVRSLDVIEVADYIPVYLVDEFSPDVANGFGTAFHGQVNDSVMNGIHPYFYLNPADSLLQTYNFLCPGMPFIIIPKGSTGPNGTDNGIMAEIAANMSAGYGPTDFYDALAYTMAYQMLEVLENPAGLIYILSGNTLEQFGAGPNPTETCYLKSLCAPFSTGAENIREFKGHSMPNFAMPSYFFPYADQISHGQAVYDSMGNGKAPLTPYKGTQFVMYQNSPVSGGLSDLQAGSYTSTDTDPDNLMFTSYGSIYTWEGWGFELAEQPVAADAQTVNACIPNARTLSTEIARGRRTVLREANLLGKAAKKSTAKIPLKATANGLFPGRKLNAKAINTLTGKSNSIKIDCKKKKTRKCTFDPKEPQLLPFQYINHEGWLTQRYAVVNYSPRLDTATLIAATQNVVDETRKLFLPHWNIMVDSTVYNVSSATTREQALAMLPIFDGTFIPFIINVATQYRTDTAAVGFLAGGASDVCNVPDVLAGPTVDFYLKDNGIFPVPDMPLGNPLVITSDLNFEGTCVVTTDQPGVGPFLMGAASFEPSNETFPITAQAVISPFGDLTLCTTPPDNTPFLGKILVFTDNPKCQTAGPQRYTNVNNSGCIASISVPNSSPTYFNPSNLGLPYVPEPSQFMVGTSTTEGNALVAAIQANPDLQITIDAPVYPTWNSVQTLTLIMSHEFHELSRDPNYATYVATSDPPSDMAMVFSQIECGDPMEAINGPLTIDAYGKIFSQESFPTPAYFIPNLKFKVYDDQGLCPKPLMPISRQQTVVHQAPVDGVNQPLYPFQLLSLETSVPGAVWSETSFIGFSIFDPTNYFEPFNNGFLFPPDIDFHDLPFFSIYHKLLTNDNVAAYNHFAILGPNNTQEF